MSGDQETIKGKDQEKLRESETEFIEFLKTCPDNGWSKTLCPNGCIVEPDGICPHNFKVFCSNTDLSKTKTFY
jgi:hypothetical protein